MHNSSRVTNFYGSKFKKEKINVAMKSSRKMVTAHWKEFLFSMLWFLLKAFIVGAVMFVGMYVLPLTIINALPLSLVAARVLKIFFISFSEYSYVALLEQLPKRRIIEMILLVRASATRTNFSFFVSIFSTSA